LEIENLLKLEYILAFATFILPGFLIMKIIRLKVPNKDFLLKDMLFEAFSYSLLNLSLFGWIPYLLLSKDYTGWSIVAFILILVISPIVLATGYIKIVSSNFFAKHFDIQMPTAWDWYFSQRPNSILLVKMKDGSEIIGYFGETSYATSYPNDGSIYIERVYIKDENGALVIVENSNGILIAKDQYTTIEFYNIAGE